ncbi:MAG: TolC family protein [Arcobacteraceae bacterium]|jgi:outer membrane protein TolC|nr:TolC family protein [Arcobacteraceae bacterium]
MKKRLLLLVLPACIYADNLKSLLEFATTNNNMVVSKNLTQKAKMLDVESTQNSYYPTIDIGGYYQRLDDKSNGIPGDVYSGYGKISFDLYDGDRKTNLIKQNEALLQSSSYDINGYKKELQLLIVQDFYTIKNLEASLETLEEKQVQLQAELQRVKRFYEVGTTTKDDVDKLEAAYSGNIYQIDAVKYQILSVKKLFSIKIGKNIEQFDDSTIVVPKNLDKEINDNIQALKQTALSLQYTANSVDATYKPQVKVEDTYSFYEYGRTDLTHPEGLDNQNKILLSVNLRLFDNDVTSKQKESILVQKKALEKQIEQNEQLQNINIELALSNIETTKAQIVSAQSSLSAAVSAYETVAQKYKVGLIDNVAYLDALSVKTQAKAQYKTALNNLQVAYAKYYYYTNKDIQEFTK